MSLPAKRVEWSNDANFPAGSEDWSGQPTKTLPADDKFTPGPDNPVGAEEFNYLFNQSDADYNRMRDLTASLALRNFSSLSVTEADDAGVTGLTDFFGVHYSTILKAWVVGYDTAGGPEVFYASDPSDARHRPAPATGSPTGNPRTFFDHGSHFYIVEENSSGANLSRAVRGGALAAITITAFDTLTNTSAAVFQGTRAVVWHTSAGGTNGYAHSTTPQTSASWAVRTAGLATVQVVIGACSPTRCASFNKNWANASNINYETTDDFATFTARTLSTSILAATEKVQGVCWSDEDELFYLLIETASGGFKVASSPDAVTWTLVSTVAVGNGVPVQIAAMGGAVLVALKTDTSSAPYFGVDGGNLLYSVDGAATWKQGGAQLYSVSSPTHNPAVAVGSGRVVFFNNETVRASLALDHGESIT